MELVSRWQLLGSVGTALLVGWVIGLQTIQGDLKPVVILTQTTIGGAIAGTVIGYANARTERTLADVQAERDKFEALFDNIPAEVAEVLEDMEKDPALKKLPVVVLTSSEAEQDVVESYEHSANAYLTKPVGYQAFQDVVRQIEEFWFEIVKLPPSE